MGSLLSFLDRESQDNTQESVQEQEVKINGNNNIIMLHEDHATILQDIRIIFNLI
jgi:hypothetical protein